MSNWFEQSSVAGGLARITEPHVHPILRSNTRWIHGTDRDTHDLGAPLPERLGVLPRPDFDAAAYRIEPVCLPSAPLGGDQINDGDGSLTVLHLPGHTPGSLALYEAHSGVLYPGDVIYDATSSTTSPSPTSAATGGRWSSRVSSRCRSYRWATGAASSRHGSISSLATTWTLRTDGQRPRRVPINDATEKETTITIHTYISDQCLHDAPHSDLRRARAAAVSTIPTSSGAAGRIIPELDGKLTGSTLRVLVPVGSIADFTARLSQPASVEEVNAAFCAAVESPASSAYLAYSVARLVSADIVDNPHSAVFDAPPTQVVVDQVVEDQVKIFAWHDNESGFSGLLELSERLGLLAPERGGRR
jgi:hypothetical protein